MFQQIAAQLSAKKVLQIKILIDEISF